MPCVCMYCDIPYHTAPTYMCIYRTVYCTAVLYTSGVCVLSNKCTPETVYSSAYCGTVIRYETVPMHRLHCTARNKNGNFFFVCYVLYMQICSCAYTMHIHVHGRFHTVTQPHTQKTHIHAHVLRTDLVVASSVTTVHFCRHLFVSIVHLCLTLFTTSQLFYFLKAHKTEINKKYLAHIQLLITQNLLNACYKYKGWQFLPLFFFTFKNPANLESIAPPFPSPAFSL